MAYQSKSEQRLAGSLNYKSSESTLNSDGIKGVKDMGSNGPSKLYGSMTGVSRERTPLYGNQVKSTSRSGLSGNMTESGYPNGPKWKRAIEPGEFKPGNRSQASNTTRMTPGKGDKGVAMKSTGTTPKALRGGRVR